MTLFYSPAKQLITEEKMAAHLNGLHISSNYTSHSLCSDEMMDMLTNMESQTQSISDQIKGRTLVLSEELKKIKSEPILPPEIIDRYLLLLCLLYLIISILTVSLLL